jgi:hypothetical protein
MTLSDDDCYQLFISLDTLARIHGGANETVNAQRERFLPFYRDWHAAHPYEVHPSARAAADRYLSELVNEARQS